MKILFMGTPEFAAQSLRTLYNKKNVQIVGVITQPDKPVGRKRTVQKPAVKIAAEELSIPVYQPKKFRDGSALKIISSLEPELIAVVAFGRIIPDDILNYPKYGCINIHGSVLPKYRGAAPIQWSVINGDKTVGVTAIYMSKEVDAGDIIDVRTVPSIEGETSGELFERLSVIGAELLSDVVDAIENHSESRTPQDNSLASYAPPLTKEMAELDFHSSAKNLYHKILGCNPWPIATAEIKGNKFKIFSAYYDCKDSGAQIGEIISADKNGIKIACSEGTIIITELQAPGGKRMSAGDYLRGHSLCQ